ncbi:phage holin family protein, partial [Dysosmobacter sp.]|uniref:phage holin family protein n=1 Tax=Dysosmobacter sp. TaxID=2591382 RepID=UPI002A90711B
LVVFDYITGVCVAIHDQKLSSAIGAKGISKKVMIFILISMSYIADNYFLQAGNTLETVTILFYCANEAISILENAAKIGIPVPEKMKNLFSSIKEKN